MVTALCSYSYKLHMLFLSPIKILWLGIDASRKLQIGREKQSKFTCKKARSILFEVSVQCAHIGSCYLFIELDAVVGYTQSAFSSAFTLIDYRFAGT